MMDVKSLLLTCVKYSLHEIKYHGEIVLPYDYASKKKTQLHCIYYNSWLMFSSIIVILVYMLHKIMDNAMYFCFF